MKHLSVLLQVQLNVAFVQRRLNRGRSERNVNLLLLFFAISFRRNVNAYKQFTTVALCARLQRFTIAIAQQFCGNGLSAHKRQTALIFFLHILRTQIRVSASVNRQMLTGNSSRRRRQPLAWRGVRRLTRTLRPRAAHAG